MAPPTTHITLNIVAVTELPELFWCHLEHRVPDGFPDRKLVFPRRLFALSHLRCLCVFVWLQIFCDLVSSIHGSGSVSAGREALLLYYLQPLNVVVSVGHSLLSCP